MCCVEITTLPELWTQTARGASRRQRRKGNSDAGEAAPSMNCDAFLLLAGSSGSIFGLSDPFPDSPGSLPRLLLHVLLWSLARPASILR